MILLGTSTPNLSFDANAKSCNETYNDIAVLFVAVSDRNESTLVARDVLGFACQQENTRNPKLLFCFGRALRRVIVNDAPAFGESLKNQCKDPADVAGLPLQVPFPEDERRIGPKLPDFEF
jgi:hypothetical protein